MITRRTEPVSHGYDEEHGLEATGVVALVTSIAQQDPLRLLAAAAALAEPVRVFFPCKWIGYYVCGLG